MLSRPANTKKCPACQGLGRRVMPTYQKQDPPCGLCSGRGWVSADFCKGCGMPVYVVDGPIQYCGKAECFGKVTKKVTSTATFTGALLPILARRKWEEEMRREREQGIVNDHLWSNMGVDNWDM